MHKEYNDDGDGDGGWDCNGHGGGDGGGDGGGHRGGVVDYGDGDGLCDNGDVGMAKMVIVVTMMMVGW